MAVREADLTKLAIALTDRDQAALDELAPRLGVALRYDLLRTLADQATGSFGPLPLVRVALAAIAHAHGIASESLRGWICLAVRDGDRVVVGLRPRDEARSTPGTVWPSLRPWYKELARNRTRAEAWARVEETDRVAFPLTATVPEQEDRTEAALIAQIVDNPDDPTPRLVLADLLMQREDPRGELIQLAAELAALPADAIEGKDRRERVKHLEERHAAELAGAIGEQVREFGIVGGFVESVTMPASTFRRCGDWMFRAQPIRRLRVRPLADDAIPTLAKAPHLALVRALDLVAEVHRPLVLAPLAEARLDRLEQIFFYRIAIAGDDADLAFENLRAPRLRVLMFNECLIGACALHGLAANSALCATLERIHVGTCYSTEWLEPDARALAGDVFAELALPNLRALRVDDRNWFGTDACMAALVTRAPRLEQFAIDNAGPLVYAAAAAHCRELRSIELRRSIPLPTFRALLELPHLESLTAWHGVDPNGAYARACIALPSDHPLRRVLLPGNPHEDELRARFPKWW